MSILKKEDALVNCDLSPAYNAIKQEVTISARFKKKEDINLIAKSILKHRIQTLTGRNIKTIEEEMDYKPLDPNETGMNEKVMKILAHCLILLANGELPQTVKHDPPAAPVADNVSVSLPPSRKRGVSSSNGGVSAVEAPKAKSSRRSIAVSRISEPIAETTPRRGRRSLAVAPSTVDSARKPKAPGCLGPTNGSEKVTVLKPKKVEEIDEIDEEEEIEEENEEEEELDDSISNPTQAMKDIMKKRKSVGKLKSPVKKASAVKAVVAKKVEPPPSPGPRTEFSGNNSSKVYLVRAEPLELKLKKLLSCLPLSVNFPGAHLSVVHTPADWTPTQIFHVGKLVKLLNKEAGLQSFVLLVGTGLSNVHLNIEALMRHTQHVQFLTFHREDANREAETGKLRETTSFFLASYFFPGCEEEDSVPPTKMVRDGYTTSFRTGNIAELEASIVDCFSEKGEWILDLACGKRQLSLAAAERGRSAIAVDSNPELLEDVGNYLRTLALTTDPTYREKDGLVLSVGK